MFQIKPYDRHWELGPMLPRRAILAGIILTSSAARESPDKISCTSIRRGRPTWANFRGVTAFGQHKLFTALFHSLEIFLPGPPALLPLPHPQICPKYGVFPEDTKAFRAYFPKGKQPSPQAGRHAGEEDSFDIHHVPVM